MKRVIIAGDFHCGHVVGLTPPRFQERPTGIGDSWDKKLVASALLWDWFAGRVEAWRPFDIAIINGDLIDGKGDRSGGTEHITTSLQRQCLMANEVIKFIGAERVAITYGTPYHVNGKDGEDWEGLIWPEADRIEGHGFYNINGVTFDVKHKVGSSSIPHGRFTQIAKEKLWNEIWSLDEGQPRADVIIRSHTHYLAYCGDSRGLAIIAPALQGMGSKFGSRQCSGTVDFGFLVFEIEDNGEYRWFPEVLECRAQAAQVVNL